MSNYIENISLECVVFTYIDNKLKILVRKYDDQLYAHPTCPLDMNEDVCIAVENYLISLGIKYQYISQFKVFSSISRIFPVCTSNKVFNGKRKVSIASYCLVRKQQDHSDKGYDWIDAKSNVSFILDHAEILEEALLSIKQDINIKPICYNLLANEFTMADMQCLYQVIINKKINRGNFYRKIVKSGMLKRTENVIKIKIGKKNSYLYVFEKQILDLNF